MNPNVDLFLIEGCKRCSKHSTPACKVNNWQSELKAIRAILFKSELEEEVKWGFPCYTLNGKNILIVGVFNDFCSINFFKGSLLKNQENLLQKQGENTQSSRVLKFKEVAEVYELEEAILALIKEAIAVERAGIKVAYKKVEELTLPDELKLVFIEQEEVAEAFNKLTPGRQKDYIYFFASAKQAKTRMSRIQKAIPAILEGKGRNDDYKC